MTDSRRNKSVVRAFVEAMNSQDWDGLDRLVAGSFVRHCDRVG